MIMMLAMSMTPCTENFGICAADVKGFKRDDRDEKWNRNNWNN